MADARERSDTRGVARRVPVTPEARARSTLARIDYADAFALETAAAADLTAEQWARELLEGAPRAGRRALRRLLAGIGLELGPDRSDGFVEGWAVRDRQRDWVLLAAASSRIALSAELLIERDDHAVALTTMLELDSRPAHAVWAMLSPVHRRVARYLVDRPARWTVLYDGDCGFCKWLLAGLLSWDRAGRLDPIALQRPEVTKLLVDLTPDERMASWHLISPAGERWSGGTALPHLLRALPGGRLPAAVFARIPRATDRGYRWVADHRVQLSKFVPSRSKRRAAERVRRRESDELRAVPRSQVT